ncbi:MAG: hypothetical protein BVN35_12425 [Proteobacteria bacterium ST_bin11]|nr:MAG: hypothetical protein BVN35_12425 [Proteobacteria bacterium ST_bin11]
MESIKREATYSEIKKYVRDKYGEINDSSLTCSIISCSVNHPSRIHYSENKKPRPVDGTGSYDFLFNTGRGRVSPYDPTKHGYWEIFEKDDGRLGVRQIFGNEEMFNLSEGEIAPDTSLFALESHLRDYLAKNISKSALFGSKLSLYISNDGRDGVEFQTDVGPIDILAVDEYGSFVVFELKLGRGPDSCLGQILRYMGWVKKHLSADKTVKGIIVAAEIPMKLRYAVTQVPNVDLMEYELSFSVKPIQL